MKKILLVTALLLSSSMSQAAQLAGVFVNDQLTAENGQVLVLNGVGLREKFWVDVYVGSLYLVNKSSNVADILAVNNAYRIQMDFVYKEVAKDKLLKAWKDGFNKNQEKQSIEELQSRIEQFYSYFGQNAKNKDQYILDYIPGKGTTIIKNKTVLGIIEGEDFKNALLEIWLGNFPADKGLKRGMLGL